MNVLLAIAVLSVAPPTTLEVKGNQILRDGEPFRMRGVAVGDPLLGRRDRPTEDYEILARDWKANAIRISVHPHTWKREQAKAIELLDRDVHAARDAGLLVLITWHSIGWPDGGYQIPNWRGSIRDTYDSNFELAKSFWAEMARRYGKDGGVLFELWNEPANFDADGKTQDYPGWAKLRPFMQGLLDEIRRESRNVVVATGGHWAYDLRGIKDAPLNGENVAYSWHVYAGHDQNDPKQWLEKLDGLDQVVPVIATEWGFQRGADAHYKGGPDDFGVPFNRLLDDHHLGWTAWIWHPQWGPPMLESDWRTPNEFGRFVKDRLAAE